MVYKNGKISVSEWGKPRQIMVQDVQNVYLEDKWRPRANENNAFLTTAFTQSIFRRQPLNTKKQKNKYQSKQYGHFQT